MKKLEPLKSLQIARAFLPPMSKAPGTDLYEIRWFENGETHSTPPASRLTTRRWRQEMILEHAATLAGSYAALSPLREQMTVLENISFWVALRRERAAAKQTPILKISPAEKSARQSARWRATHAEARDRDMLERAHALTLALNPPPPDAPQAVEAAAARIAARRPDLAPRAIAELARWVAGTL